MRKSVFLLLPGLLCLFLSSAAVAHQSGHHGGYGGYGPSGSFSIWGDPYGQVGYAGSLHYGWNSVPYGGHVHGPGCGYAPRHHGAWGKGYRKGYKHGRRHGHHKRHRKGHGHHGH
jgi:hypothetical protein